MAKMVVVTGGVVSSLGKGIAAASLGLLLKQRGLRVTLQKLDPYLNIDPGTMSPFQHGEVFVTDDGAETDLDLGHCDRPLTSDLREKIALFCNLPTEAVIDANDVGSIYEVPVVFRHGGLDALVVRELSLAAGELDLKAWEGFVSRILNPTRQAVVGLVGKYTHVRDAYKSIIEAVVHAGPAHPARVEPRGIEGEDGEL